MTTTQYKNIIDHTVKFLAAEDSENSVKTAIKILNNRGISLPETEPSAIREALSGGDYLGWEACTEEEAQTYANDGFAVVGVSDDRIVVIEPELEGVEKSGNKSVATVSDISGEEKASMSFFSGGKAATGYPIAVLPERIAQMHNDPDWNASLWGSYAKDSEEYGCSMACISMALSNIGIAKTPLQLINRNVQLKTKPFFANWEKYGVTCSKKHTLSDLEECIDNYRYNPSTYAPPIVRVSTPNGNSHYIVVYELDNSTDIVYALDPGGNGYDYINNTIRPNYWRVSNFGGSDGSYQIVQYHK